MLNNYSQTFKTSLHFFLSAFTILFLLSTQSFAQAVYKKGPRAIDSSYSGSGSSCNVESLSFMDPMSTDDNADYIFEADNPICYAWLAGSFATFYALKGAASVACSNFASGALGAAGYSPAMAAAIIADTSKCIALTGAASVPGAGLGIAAQAAACCATSTASAVAAVGSPLIGLSTIWTAANDAQTYAKICGEKWNIWRQDTSWKGGIENHPKWDYEKGTTSYQAYLEAKVKSNTLTFDISSKEYREYIYGGIEVEDSGDDACPAPNWSSATKKKILGYDTASPLVVPDSLPGTISPIPAGTVLTSNKPGNLRYYFRGAKSSPNFACDRFLLNKNNSKEEIAEGRKSFSCCNKRSQNAICIESANRFTPTTIDRGFCTLGSRCNIKDVWYEVYDSKVQSNYLCAKTYSVCPYNHPLGGGTEEPNYDKDGILVNYCQFMKHCIKKPDMAFVKINDLEGAYIASACFDLKGDSQNDYSYNSSLLPINTKHFSAPMAQCFKETMENIFLNKAGNTKCKDPDETPDSQDVCVSGYIYKKGQVTTGISFFEKVQTNIKTIIQLTLTMAITVMGINMLMGGKTLERKELMMFLIKIAMVMYFAMGTAWQTFFFDGVFNSGMVVANIVMQPNEQGKTENRLDGCQFPKWNYADLTDTNKANFTYPPGKQYLRIWDILDCKIARALGFGPEVSAPNLVLMILAGFFTFGAGIVFFVGAFIFAFFLLSLVIRALHTFLLSSISIVLLIYVSPITITCALFKRTEQIYKKWQSNLMGIVLQPIILFAYLGILITVFDKTMIGDVTFSGDGKSAPKQIICDNVTNNTSIYCIFRIADVQNPPSTDLDNLRKVLGINIPMLLDMNKEKVGSVLKAAFLMYIFGEILGQIPRLSSVLVGGSPISGRTKSAAEMAKRSFKVLSSIQKRGMRGSIKATKKIVPGAARAVGAAKESKLVQGMVSEKPAVNESKVSELKRPQELKDDGGDGGAGR